MSEPRPAPAGVFEEAPVDELEHHPLPGGIRHRAVQPCCREQGIAGPGVQIDDRVEPARHPAVVEVHERDAHPRLVVVRLEPEHEQPGEHRLVAERGEAEDGGGRGRPQGVRLGPGVRPPGVPSDLDRERHRQHHPHRHGRRGDTPLTGSEGSKGAHGATLMRRSLRHRRHRRHRPHRHGRYGDAPPTGVEGSVDAHGPALMRHSSRHRRHRPHRHKRRGDAPPIGFEGSEGAHGATLMRRSLRLAAEAGTGAVPRGHGAEGPGAPHSALR